MSGPNVLSGGELVHNHAKTNHELPPAGIKEFQPTNSWLEKKQVQSALEHRKALLEEERVEKWSCLMAAEWIPEKGKAKVKQKGKSWEVFGHHSHNMDWLFPEEVLLLMEMNCLECLSEEIPLSIQKGYTILLQPENGCSVNEYRVFAHLCRMGYRVVRHLPDLSVTAYEKQIRLDQHLDQRKTYNDTKTCEPEIPRPDLPPKKILHLLENTEITIEASNLLDEPLSLIENHTNLSKETKVEKQIVENIEVIDLIDSSSEDSSSNDSSSGDSDIEIIHVSAPLSEMRKNYKPLELEDDGEVDIEIVEGPEKKMEIIVTTIESSDSEKDKESSDTDSNKSYDGNWKRNDCKKEKKQFVRSASMIKLKYLAVEEFCSDKPLSLITEHVQSINGKGDGTETLNEVASNSHSTDCIRIDSKPSQRIRPLFSVLKTRNEILDLMPTMAQQSTKIMSLESPDRRLIPDNIKPRQQSYTFNTNSLRARVFSSFRAGYRGRRYFHGPRFNSYNPFYDNINNNFFSNQLSVRNPLLQSPILTDMFGSDIHSVARGMMQFASALLLNTPQNNPSNCLIPYNTQPNRSHFNMSGYTQNNFGSQSFEEPLRNVPNQIRFPPSSFRSVSPGNENNLLSPQNRSFRSDSLIDSKSSGGNNSDFDSRKTNFTPPFQRSQSRQFNYSTRSRPRRRPFSRNYLNQSESVQNFGATDPIYSSADPAYMKSDVPLPGEQNIHTEKSNNFIPISSSNQKPLEVINILDNDDDFVSKPHGISNRFQRKRKRRMRQQSRKMAKKTSQKKNTLRKSPCIVFLDSPVASTSSIDSLPVKVEENSGSLGNSMKTETGVQDSSVKEELSEEPRTVKVEDKGTENSSVKIENRQTSKIKSEENNEAVVKIEQRSDIKMECSSYTSPVSTVPIESLVKTEDELSVKSELDEVHPSTEPFPDVKTEPSLADVKTENSTEEVVENNINVGSVVENNTNVMVERCVRELNVSKEICEIEADIAVDKNINEISRSSEVKNRDLDEGEVVFKMETDVLSNFNNSFLKTSKSKISDLHNNESSSEMDAEVFSENCDILVSNNKPNESILLHKNEDNVFNVSSWAEVKKHNVPIVSFQLSEGEEGSNEEINNDEENYSIQSLIKPKHCKTTETVLSALQIFSPFSPKVSKNIPKLKISFDMYLPSEFRKSQRGLPQFRIAVFEGRDTLPCPDQLFELQTRFKDSVPVLRAIIMPDSIVFYTSSSISLPVDMASYGE